jgi:hypothetical protein
MTVSTPFINFQANAFRLSGKPSNRLSNAVISDDSLRSLSSSRIASVEHLNVRAIAATLSPGGAFLPFSQPAMVFSALSMASAKAF